ncbi:MAG: caspase, EACC1-associated type [Pseudonocardiaceae bacterium]
MIGTRVALLVGCSEYKDQRFPDLPTSAQDIEALTAVLADPTIGEFVVEALPNKPSEEVREKIEGFFAERKPDDLLLLYFSCHGVLDDRGQLYFVAANTKKELLDATGISAQWVKKQMDQSRSQRIVLLLECCYSGAFNKGLRRGPADAEDVLEQLSGHGRVVITASDKLEYAYGSDFTNAVVKGLQTGAADLDGDGRISVDELYQYVYDQVRQSKHTQDQTPTKSTDGMRGQLYLAKNFRTPLPLPDELEQALASDIVWKRLWAVDGLRHLLAGDHPGGQKRRARQALNLLRDNDTEPRIQEAAGKALDDISPQPVATDPRPQTPYWLAVINLILALVLNAVYVVPTALGIGCSPSVRPTDSVLTLGTLLPNSGTFFYAGAALKAGVDLAWKDIQAVDPPSLDVRLDEANRRNEGTPSADTADRSTDELLASEVDAIIGPATSPVAVKVIDKVVCAGVILFAPANTSPVFTEWPDHGLYFRTAPLSTLEGAALGNLIVDDGNSTVVLMSRDDAFGNPLREATEEAVQKSGVQIRDSFPYDPNAPYHDEEIQQIKDHDPDAIVLIGFEESAQILAKMIEMGIGPQHKKVYASGAMMTKVLTGRVDSRNPSVLAGMQGAPLDTGDEEFVKRLREVNPQLDDLTYAAEAYDAVVITVLAAASAKTGAPADIANEINGVTKDGEKCTGFAICLALIETGKNIDYDGPSGELEFTDAGEPLSGTYVISEFQDDGTVKAGKHVSCTMANSTGTCR